MASPAFESIVEDFEFLEDWEDRYRLVIELGRKMPEMELALKVPATKVDGCASQVWLHVEATPERFDFSGDSDAMIVRGLIALLHALYSGISPAEAALVDAHAELGRLGLAENLSAQRSNGLRAMIERLKEESRARAV